MIIVTGGAGFIGSNLVAKINEMGVSDILVVDDLADGAKILNISDLDIADYLDKDELFTYLSKTDSSMIDVIFHLGACSATTEWDGKFLMKNNFEYSKKLFHWAQDNNVAFIYASSASVYGLGEDGFTESQICEKPINAYAYSKLLFDRYVFSQSRNLSSQVVGLRYFNVYGSRENHKGTMVSPAFSFFQQIKELGVAKIFEGSHGYASGEHKRDFIYVSDCADVNWWFYKNSTKSGVFNVGTGSAVSFNKVAENIIKNEGHGTITYVPFPNHLKAHYQAFTQANISALRSIGYTEKFLDIDQGVKRYYKWLTSHRES